jgi:hypothetical protein
MEQLGITILLILQQESGISLGVVLQYLGYLGYLFAALGGYVIWRTGLNKLISDSNQTLIKNQGEELDLSESKIKELRERLAQREIEFRAELQDLKDDNRLLRKDAIVRSEISDEDKLTIKLLREEIFRLKQ